MKEKFNWQLKVPKIISLFIGKERRVLIKIEFFLGSQFSFILIGTLESFNNA